MKITDILTESILLESVTFFASREEDHPEYGKLRSAPGEVKLTDCEYCEGKGHDDEYVHKNGEDYIWDSEYDELPDEEKANYNPVPCRFCKGQKQIERFVSDSPELNVANRNARILQGALRLPEEESGHIDNKDLPELKRRIIKLMNSDTSDYAFDTYAEKPTIRTSKEKGNVTRISRGPTIYQMGFSQEQLDRYLKSLLEIIRYAQKHGYDLSWG